MNGQTATAGHGADDLARVRDWVRTTLPGTRGRSLESLESAAKILDRDLLPRLENKTLIVGLVGPNNAGKS
ncbi:MAG: hypothetical protein P1V35_12580, partial [Planctomycetota bacterium]|nr:hypothetical protein [Planctomycetota bacterium]